MNYLVIAQYIRWIVFGNCRNIAKDIRWIIFISFRWPTLMFTLRDLFTSQIRPMTWYYRFIRQRWHLGTLSSWCGCLLLCGWAPAHWTCYKLSHWTIPLSGHASPCRRRSCFQELWTSRWYFAPETCSRLRLVDAGCSYWSVVVCAVDFERDCLESGSQPTYVQEFHHHWQILLVRRAADWIYWCSLLVCMVCCFYALICL